MFSATAYMNMIAAQPFYQKTGYLTIKLPIQPKIPRLNRKEKQQNIKIQSSKFIETKKKRRELLIKQKKPQISQTLNLSIFPNLKNLSPSWVCFQP
jgi:hypothetical protein